MILMFCRISVMFIAWVSRVDLEVKMISDSGVVSNVESVGMLETNFRTSGGINP